MTLTLILRSPAALSVVQERCESSQKLDDFDLSLNHSLKLLEIDNQSALVENLCHWFVHSTYQTHQTPALLGAMAPKKRAASPKPKAVAKKKVGHVKVEVVGSPTRSRTKSTSTTLPTEVDKKGEEFWSTFKKISVGASLIGMRR